MSMTFFLKLTRGFTNVRTCALKKNTDFPTPSSEVIPLLW